MYWSDLKDKALAPQTGWMLVYTKKEKPLFHSYENISQVEEELNGKELLEIHLFDREKEYRAVGTRSSRFPGGVNEALADFPEDQDYVYAEAVLLEERKDTITVLNHMKYDDQDGDKKAAGMAVIDNYRLRM